MRKNTGARRVDRRTFMRDSAMLLAGSALVGCGMDADDAPPPDLLVAQFCDTGLCPFGVLRFDGRNGAPLGPFVRSDANGGMAGPDGIAFGPDGNLYIGSFWTHEVMQFDGETGRFTRVFVTRGRGGVHTPHNFTWDSQGRFYLTSRGTSSILRYDGKTGSFLDVFIPAGRGGLTDPTDLAFRSDGMLYVSDFTTDGRPPATADPRPRRRGGAIRRYDARTGAYIDDFVAPAPPGGTRPEGLDGPHSLVFGPDNHLYVSSSLSGRVLRYHGRTGVFMDALVSPGSQREDEILPSSTCTARGDHCPTGLAFAPDGKLYVSDYARRSVLRFDPGTGAFLGEFVANTSGCGQPGGITFPPPSHNQGTGSGVT